MIFASISNKSQLIIRENGEIEIFLFYYGKTICCTVNDIKNHTEDWEAVCDFLFSKDINFIETYIRNLAFI